MDLHLPTYIMDLPIYNSTELVNYNIMDLLIAHITDQTIYNVHVSIYNTLNLSNCNSGATLVYNKTDLVNYTIT